MTRHAYGHKPPRVPHTFLLRHRIVLGAAPLPDVADLSANCPPVIDQGQIGSCTGCSGVAAIGTLARKQANDRVWIGSPIIGSALGLYYEERARDGTTDQDAGASLADAVAVLSSLGCIPDADWPYDEARAMVEPPAIALGDAAKVKLADYAALDHDVDTIRACLAMGFPVQIGVQVYDSFESDAVNATGDVPMPDTAREQLVGGHAILLVGYNHPQRRFKFRNSWGTSWGANGYGTLPYDLVSNIELCSELYVYRRLAQTT